MIRIPLLSCATRVQSRGLYLPRKPTRQEPRTQATTRAINMAAGIPDDVAPVAAHEAQAFQAFVIDGVTKQR